MQRLCPNCGSPVEQDEIFCPSCGTKVGTGHEEYIQYQPQNTPPYYSSQSYQQPTYNQYQKPKSGSKVLKIVIITVGVIVLLLIALVIIGTFSKDKEQKTTIESTKPPVSETSKPTPVESKSPPASTAKQTQTDSSKPAPDQMLVTWDGDIDVKANYNLSEKKIYVDYSIVIKNVGKGNAQNINVYLDPESSDENAKYLGMKPRTIVNFDSVLIQLNMGSEQQIKTQFFYSNIESSKAGKNNLQDIVNRYLLLPVLIEWEENGKKYSDRKIPH